MGVMPAAMAGPGPRRRGDAIVGDELDTRCVKRYRYRYRGGLNASLTFFPF
jgi:hypothetical protein